MLRKEHPSQFRVVRGEPGIWGVGATYKVATAAEAVKMDNAAHARIDGTYGGVLASQTVSIIAVYTLVPVDPKEWQA